MINIPRSLSFRLTLWYTSAFLVCLFLAFMGLYLSLHSILDRRMNEDLQEDITEFQELFAEEGFKQVIREIQREVNSSDESEIFFRLFDQTGHMVHHSDLSDWDKLDSERTFAPPQNLTQSHPIIKILFSATQEHPTKVISGFIGPNAILQIGETLEKQDEMREVLLMVFASIFFLGIPLASSTGWLIARRAVSGINEVSRGAQALERGDLDHRVSVTAKEDEIQRLANTFNTMADRIKSLIHEMREMTDNIAHDLRSPLARIRAIAETSLSQTESQQHKKKSAADTLKECDRLIHLINATLDIAEVDAGVNNQGKSPIHLSQLIADLCELFEAAAEEKHITLKIHLEQNCHIVGDKHLLQRMVANLLDNAVKYTLSEGEVSIELTRFPHECSLTITDTGSGIPYADQNRIFDRFFRCDQSRSLDGCGLGLSFARSVARAHGGDITVTSEASKGSIFTSIFPLVSPTE